MGDRFTQYVVVRSTSEDRAETIDSLPEQWEFAIWPNPPHPHQLFLREVFGGKPSTGFLEMVDHRGQKFRTVVF